MKINNIKIRIFYFSLIYSVSQLIIRFLSDFDFAVTKGLNILLNNFIVGLLISYLFYFVQLFISFRKKNKENLLTVFFNYKIEKSQLYKIVFFLGFGFAFLLYLLETPKNDLTIRELIVLNIKSFGLSLFISFFLFWLIESLQRLKSEIKK
jgi:hypothetical protein